jgi:hypothetical protein
MKTELGVMAFKRKLVSLSAAAALTALYAVPSLANVQTWDFNSSSQGFSNNNFGNSLNLTSSDGITLKVTGWSDTNDVSGPDTVETARLSWASDNGLGVQNRDEGTNPPPPDHSVDSVLTGNDRDGEFDMLLLEFGTAVNLSSLKLNWATGGSSDKTSDLSVLAWDGTGSSGLAGNTWGNVLDSNGGNYESVGNYSNVGLSYYTVNTANVESTKWLVGVYNPVFGAGGSAGNDGFKLTSLKTSNTVTPTPGPTPVPLPGTVALVLVGLLGLRARGKVKTTKRH